MSKFVKDMIIGEFQRRIGDCRDFLIVNPSRLDAVSSNTMRVKLRGQNISMLMIKNTLIRKALRDTGLNSVDRLLCGPSALVWGGPDIVALSKEIAKWAKQLKLLEIKGGVVDGEAVGPAEVEAISNGPSREELIGQIVTLMLSPGARLAGALLAPGGSLASQIQSIAEKEPDAPAGEAAT